MEEKEVIEIASTTELVLAESRVKCIVDNAKCMMKVSTEHMFNVYTSTFLLT
jgi:DNA-3-methyladenine glycosylase I